VKEAVTAVLVIILMVVEIIAVMVKAMTVVITIIIIIIHVITFMQGIYNYIPETNRVSGVHRVVFTICATCHVISPVKYVLYFYISLLLLLLLLLLFLLVYSRLLVTGGSFL